MSSLPFLSKGSKTYSTFLPYGIVLRTNEMDLKDSKRQILKHINVQKFINPILKSYRPGGAKDPLGWS